MNISLLGYFTLLLSCFFEGYLYINFFDATLKRRVKGIKFYTIVVSLFLILFVVNTCKIPQFNLIFSILILYIVLFTLYVGSLIKKLLFALFIVALMMSVEIVLAVNLIFILNVDITTLVQDEVYNFIMLLLAKTLLFIFIRVIIQFFVRSNSKIDNKYFVIFLVFPVSSILVYESIISMDITFIPSKIAILVIGLIGLLVVNIFSFYLFSTIMEKAEKTKQLALLKQRRESDELRYKEIRSRSLQLRALEHDYNKHLNSIGNLAVEKDYAKIVNYVNEVLNTEVNYLNQDYTGYKLVDIIIEDTIKKLRDIGTKVELDINNCDFSRIKDSDLSILFGNLFDNVLESVKESNDKFMYFGITKVKGYIKIEITNSSDKEPLIKGDIILSNKEGKNERGFGTRNIRKIVSKYEGLISYKHYNEYNRFSTIIHLLK
ncbi:GHKL domain-containing protein [Mycoplasmatota bacterium WC44]